jgi:hypothetical protein
MRSSSWPLRASLAALLMVPSMGAAQQVADSGFRHPIAQPAFVTGKGPMVCMDVAHNNHPAEHRFPGTFHPLVALLRADGYRVRDSREAFSAGTLGECEILIVATAMSDAHVGNWWLPRASAFTSTEISELHRWLRRGGALLLIADHIPTSGAVADLGAILGVIPLDGWARLRPDTATDVFARARGEVADHSITRGRSAAERIDSVATFHGHAFRASREWAPLLLFSAGSVGFVPIPDLPRAEWPHFPVEGWAHAAARRIGKGRVVWLGEVSTCTALRGPIGMNHPAARQNAQFCLNTARWLSGVLADG